MKKAIHPQYNLKSNIVCNSCGTTFQAGSTQDEIHVELCSNCHPFYTGEAGRLVDTDSRLKNYFKRAESSNVDAVIKKRKKRETRKSSKTGAYAPSPQLTLRDMLKKQ